MFFLIIVYDFVLIINIGADFYKRTIFVISVLSNLG